MSDDEIASMREECRKDQAEGNIYDDPQWSSETVSRLLDEILRLRAVVADLTRQLDSALAEAWWKRGGAP